MIKISKLADYALVLMDGLSDSGSVLYSAKQLSETTRIPLPTVSKVLKLLADADLVKSVRGVRGGYCLTQALSATSVADVITAIDGDLALTECSDSNTECQLSEHCRLRSNWQYISCQVQRLLSGITLSDMSKRLDAGDTYAE